MNIEDRPFTREDARVWSQLLVFIGIRAALVVVCAYGASETTGWLQAISSVALILVAAFTFFQFVKAFSPPGVHDKKGVLHDDEIL